MNINIFKYLAYIFLIFWIISKSHAQIHFQRMDEPTRNIEYKITQSKIKSNEQEIKYLINNKKYLSSFDKDAFKIKAMQQSIIQSKQEENFRLNHKILFIEKARQNPINYGTIYK